MSEAYCHSCKKDIQLAQLEWDALVVIAKIDMVFVDVVGRCPICGLIIRRTKGWLNG